DRESLPSPAQTENISGTKVFWTGDGPGTVVRLGISLKVPPYRTRGAPSCAATGSTDWTCTRGLFRASSAHKTAPFYRGGPLGGSGAEAQLYEWVGLSCRFTADVCSCLSSAQPPLQSTSILLR